MGLAVFKERRLSNRRKLTGLLPGRLLMDETKVEIVSRPVDVSAHGLGIVVAQELKPGQTISLVMRDTTVQLEVAWSQPDFGKHDMFRYGLVVREQDLDLEQLFIASGCLR